MKQNHRNRLKNERRNILWKSMAVKNIEEHLQAPPKSLLLAQTEDYIEYSPRGKGMEKRKARNTKAEILIKRAFGITANSSAQIAKKTDFEAMCKEIKLDEAPSTSKFAEVAAPVVYRERISCVLMEANK
ncbi:hypothetical protein GQX74_011011 [Glossina fuscipes]|nr:hypothetical protein GQX74_011011 [Glossina fuscipes]